MGGSTNPSSLVITIKSQCVFIRPRQVQISCFSGSAAAKKDNKIIQVPGDSSQPRDKKGRAVATSSSNLGNAERNPYETSSTPSQETEDAAEPSCWPEHTSDTAKSGGERKSMLRGLGNCIIIKIYLRKLRIT